MESRKFKYLILLVSAISVAFLYLSFADITLLFSPLTADVRFELEVGRELNLRESYLFGVKEGGRYRMLYRFWSEPLSFKEKPGVPHILLRELSGSPYFYAKDYRGRVEGNFPPRFKSLIKALAMKNEVGLFEPSYFRKGVYLLTASYLLYPPVEFFEGLGHVNLKLADEHVPYPRVLLTVYDPEQKVVELCPHFPYYSLKRSGDVYLIEGYAPAGALLGVELLLKGEVNGFLREYPSLLSSFRQANRLPQLAHGLWLLLLWLGRAFLVLLPPLLLYLYRRFGREREFTVPYFLSYIPNPERPPWLVNLVFTGDAFEGDENGFYATLLDLHRRGVVELKEGGEVVIKGSLPREPYERELLTFLTRFSKVEDGKRVFKPLYIKEVARRLRLNSDITGLKLLKGEIERLLNYSNPLLSGRFVDRRGSTLIKLLALFSFLFTGALILLLLLFGRVLFYTFDLYPLIFLSLGLSLSLFLCLLLPTQFFGRWRENYYFERLQWEAFRNFLRDVAAIKKYAPQDLSIWKEWLIYGTALGVADGVKRAMEELKVEIPEVREIETFRTYFSSGYSEVNSSISSLSGGGSGGSSFGGGGGFGGGGAGGR